MASCFYGTHVRTERHDTGPWCRSLGAAAAERSLSPVHRAAGRGRGRGRRISTLAAAAATFATSAGRHWSDWCRGGERDRPAGTAVTRSAVPARSDQRSQPDPASGPGPIRPAVPARSDQRSRLALGPFSRLAASRCCGSCSHLSWPVCAYTRGRPVHWALYSQSPRAAPHFQSCSRHPPVPRKGQGAEPVPCGCRHSRPADRS